MDPLYSDKLGASGMLRKSCPAYRKDTIKPDISDIYILIKWWSFIVLKTSDFLIKRMLRDMEKLSLKIVPLGRGSQRF